MKVKFPRYFIVEDKYIHVFGSPVFKFEYYSLHEDGEWRLKREGYTEERLGKTLNHSLMNWSKDRKYSREVSREELALILS